VIDFSRPCAACVDGRHSACVGAEGLCGCIVLHGDEDRLMRGFKHLKQQLHPERASWTRGGFKPGEPTDG
jgi:hypothetical protein